MARTRPRQRRPGQPTSADVRMPFDKASAPEGPSEVEQRIFAATEQLLAEISLDELKVSDILTRANLARTTFYRYFTSKHQVVSAMLGAVQLELVGVMQPWFARGDREPAEALQEALEAVAQVWSEHRPVLRASSEHWHSEAEIGERWVAMLDSFTADISKQIDRERKIGAAPPGVDSRQLALHLTWGSERMLYLGGFGICGPGLEQDAVEAMTATWLGTIYHR